MKILALQRVFSERDTFEPCLFGETLGYDHGSRTKRRVLLMRGLIRCLGLVLPILMSFGASSSAQYMTAKQTEIFHTAARADGWLTEEMHKIFWSEMPKEVLEDPQAMKEWPRFFESSSIVGMKFQREAWSSLRETLANKRVVKTPGFEEAKAAIRASEMWLYAQSKIETSLKSAEVMLEAAAKGVPAETHRGKIFLTEDLVNQVLSGLEASVCRLNILNNPRWQSELKEWRYDQARINILAQCPLALEVKDEEGENGRKIKVTTLSHSVSKRREIGLAFMELDGLFSTPSSSIIDVTQATLAGMGVQDPKVLEGEWRSRMSATGSGEASTPEGKIYASTSTVYAPEHKGVWTFVAVSIDSRADASALLEQLKNSVREQQAP